MHNYVTKIFSLLLTTLLPVFANATCTNTIESTTPTNRFSISNNGTVNDMKTGLMWKKCSEGQNGTNCSNGSIVQYTWQQALQQVKSVNDNGGFAGYSDWRLPNIKELLSIVDRQCYPSINLNVFPHSMDGFYWSSSPITFRDDIWIVGFGWGSPDGVNKSDMGSVRLVR